MMSERTHRIVGVGSVFIDDVVLPDGQTRMGQLGGGVLHAMMGAALWDEYPAIVGFIGNGLPQTAESFIHKHLDTRGLHRLSLPQARVWQLFEEDGTRREVPRVKEIRPFEEGPQPVHFPRDYANCAGLYLIQSFEGIPRWQETEAGITLWEPLQQVMTPGALAPFREALKNSKCDVVSPNLIEARALYGNLSPSALVDSMLEDGIHIVALRMGPHGSILANIRERYWIPAVPVPTILDQTGAGNTYNGALLTGLVRGKSLVEAGCMAAVAASFCLEQYGVLDPDLVDRSERNRRYQLILSESRNELLSG